jgi:hypothetical protein
MEENQPVTVGRREIFENTASLFTDAEVVAKKRYRVSGG